MSPKSKNNLYELVAQNLLIDLVSIFEEYLQEILRFLLNSQPKLALSKDKKIDAFELLNHGTIDQLIQSIIDEKVLRMMYGSWSKIINFIRNGFKLEPLQDQKNLHSILYWKEVRNLLVHNRGILNDQFFDSLKKNRIEVDGKIGERIEAHPGKIVEFAYNLKLIANDLFEEISGQKAIELVEDPFMASDDSIIDSYHNNRKEDKKIKINRNAPCYCGSHKKYKHCCLKK